MSACASGRFRHIVRRFCFSLVLSFVCHCCSFTVFLNFLMFPQNMTSRAYSDICESSFFCEHFICRIFHTCFSFVVFIFFLFFLPPHRRRISSTRDAELFFFFFFETGLCLSFRSVVSCNLMMRRTSQGASTPAPEKAIYIFLLML